jgi:MOSC domain-containing protein YiiM
MAVLTRLDFTGTVTVVLASPKRRTGLEKARHARLTLTFDGVVGDCHASRTRASDVRMIEQYQRGTEVANTRQLSILSEEELAEVATRMGLAGLPPEWVGANLVTRGIPDLTLLPPSTRLMFSSGATLIVDMENAPCRYVGAVIDKHHPGKGAGFVAAARHKRGVVAWVERPGDIAVGDSIALHVPPQRIYGAMT